MHNNKTLLQHALDLLKSAGADQVLVSGEVTGVESIPDILPDCGPLGGLHAAVHFIEKQGPPEGSLLLVIPVDMPRLTVEALARLVVSIGDADSCHYNDEIFPCVFRLSGKFRKHLDSLFSESRELGGNRSMKALLRAFNEKTVSARDLSEDVFMNLNRPEDWQRFQQVVDQP